VTEKEAEKKLEKVVTKKDEGEESEGEPMSESRENVKERISIQQESEEVKS
jgi:hypothetical protein